MVSERGKQNLQLNTPDSTCKIGIHWKPNAFSLTFDTDKVYTFLRDGRLFSVFRSGDFFQRGLNNQVLFKGRDPEYKHKVRKLLSPQEAGTLINTIFGEIHNLYDRADSEIEPEPREILQTILHWSPERLQQNGQQFQSIYAPISILPPDQYLSIVLQLSLGCSYNRCNFCNFYKDRPFQIKDLDHFEQHISSVHAFLGDSNQLRKGIFLADGDALMTPQKRLMAAIKCIRSYYPNLPLYSFMDAFRPGVKDLQDWQDLQEQGLKRVYFGIESADPDLLHFLNKPGKPSETLTEVQILKAAGISLGLIFMVGAGGQEYAKQHFEASINWLRQLELDQTDYIFLSEFIPHPDQPYSQTFAAAGLSELNTHDREQEMSHWLHEVKKLKARTVPYHLQEFIY